ncbi:hypothetical protein LUZ60_009946 [Juncus effusus]|nr:hypothetical protein LUZ60_009946 [Juncus effusus]
MEGKWIRGRTIGYGSMATVYLATSVESGEVFAVKSKELAHAEDLKNEQSILCSLNSPYVVSYLGYDTTIEGSKRHQVYNLFMEYEPNGSLSDEIKKKGGWLSEDQVRVRSSEILHGLAHLHEQQIVHCDIKSQNILISSNGCAKIADFGCSKKGLNGEKIRGTPIFMAPEVARGEEQRSPADIWALGCVIIEMFTGNSPWISSSDPFSAMHRIGFSDSVPVVPNWISDEAKDFLSKCLKRDSNERWSTKELLNHPFVASAVSKQSMSNWVSPTSNLDTEFWNSISSDDEGEDEEELYGFEIIRILSDGICEFPDWTEDEQSWITVRSNEEIESVSCDDEEIMISDGDLEFSFVSYSLSEIRELLEGNVVELEQGISALLTYLLTFKMSPQKPKSYVTANGCFVPPPFLQDSNVFPFPKPIPKLPILTNHHSKIHKIQKIQTQSHPNNNNK